METDNFDTLTEKYLTSLLRKFAKEIKGILGVYLFDRNGNLIESLIANEDHIDKNRTESLIISSGVLYLSAMKLLQGAQDRLDLCIVQLQIQYLFFLKLTNACY
jgi:hypothetical protein